MFSALSGDVRLAMTLVLATLSIVFLRYAIKRNLRSLMWASLAGVFYGVAQLAATPPVPIVSATAHQSWLIATLIGLVSIAALVAGFSSMALKHIEPRTVFMALALLLPIAYAVCSWLLPPSPYLYQLLIALTFTGLGIVLLTARHLSWRLRSLAAGASLLYPVLMIYAIRTDTPVADFRPVSILTIAVVIAFLLAVTLNSELDNLRNESTARLDAERRLKEAHLELEKKIHERTDQLEAINARLREFNGMVSHDIQAPIRNISALSSLILEQVDNSAPHEIRELARHIKNESARAAVMTTELLALASAEARPVKVEPIDLNAVFADAVEHLSIQYPGTKAAVSWARLPLVWGSAMLMPHIVENLLSNSLKFGKDSPALRIEASAARLANAWRLQIKDNGPGFDPDKAKALFQPFSRLSGTGIQGHGIGLYIVHRIVEVHGGQVGANSQVGEGSTFWWTIPDPPHLASGACLAD